MTRDQATEILAMLGSAFPQLPVEAGTVAVYQDALVGWDYRDAHAAAVWCTTHMKRFPTIADLREATGTQRRNRELDERRSKPRPDEPRRAREMPTWVCVWAWARELRDPPERRHFPQIVSASDPDTGQPAYLVSPDEPQLSWDDYTQLEHEWREAGEPRVGLAAPLPELRVGEAVKQVPA